MDSGPNVEEKLEVVVLAEDATELKRAVENLNFILQSYKRRVELNHRKVRVVLRTAVGGPPPG